MNYLTSIYGDDHYRCYCDASPRFCVAAVASSVEDAGRVAQVLEQVSPRIGVTSTTKVAVPSVPKSVPPAPTRQLLRSDWCARHRQSVYSCIILVCWVDRLDAESTPAAVAEDLVLRIGAPVDAIHCDVVFAPCRDSAAEEKEGLRTGIEKSLRSLLGSRLAGSAPQTSENNVWRGVAALQRIVLESVVAFHKDAVHRLRERREEDAADAERQYLVPRHHFKIGWHYLVMQDFSNARRQMLSGLRKLKALFPLFPSFEARLCGSVFLWHFLFCVSVSGGHLSATSDVYREVRHFADWIGQAYGGSVSDECQTVISVLTRLMEAEWLEYLARKTENLDTRQCCDYLVAAALALQDCVTFFPSRGDGSHIGAPSYIGEEEVLGDHAAALWRCLDKSTVRSRIARLLAEAKTLGSRRETEVGYLAFLAGDELLDGVPDTEAIDRVLAKASGPIISRIAEVAWGAASSWGVLSPRLTAALLLHGCVDPLHRSEQARYRQRMHELEGRLCADVVLEYPKGRLHAPFTALAYFSDEGSRVVGGTARVTIVLFSTSAACVDVCVGMLTLSSAAVDGSAETKVALHPAKRRALCAAASQEFVTDVPLMHSGGLVCSCLDAEVRVGEVCIAVRWHFPRDDASGSGRPVTGARVAVSATLARQTLHVSNPPTVFSVECPSLLQAVEGECAECEVVVACGSFAVRSGCMTLPHEPRLFRAVCWSTANEPLPMTESHGQLRVVVPDLAANESVRLLLSIACIRSAEFRLPVAVDYVTDRYGAVNCRKTLHVSVDPPFDVEHAMMGGSLWGSPAAALSIPSTSPAYTQHDKSVLVKAADIFSSPLATDWKDDCALYFFIKDAPAQDFLFQRGDTVTLSCTLRCTAKRGVTVLHAEVVAGEDVEMLADCCGDSGVFLGDGECATVMAQFQARRLGRVHPGLIRVFFAPHRATTRLYSDVCIPAIQVEDTGVHVSADYPMTAACGTPLALDVTVYNPTRAPFIGELAMDLSPDDFVCAATTRRSLQIAPAERDVAHFTLTPLRVGELRLPRFHVRCAATLRRVASADEGYVVHVLP
ncbi:Gryzun trafficking through Golgi [Novymonas esmeraldas]|uniref:Gryzun trafficking through Golgi n=1 Tax=Novymonas esmeraldas TaxID=1808958 RepID=A0AAW0F2D9_9TRYP